MNLSPSAEKLKLAHVGSPEPAFYPLAGGALRLARTDLAMVDYFAARVESAPRDLLSHTRRILAAMSLKNPEELFGALVDLFIATGNKAFDLRAGLLRQSMKFLPHAQQIYLFRQLSNGLSAQTPLVAPRSRLTAGRISPDQAIARPSSQNGENRP